MLHAQLYLSEEKQTSDKFIMLDAQLYDEDDPSRVIDIRAKVKAHFKHLFF